MIRRALVPGLLAWVVPALALASPQPTAHRVGALLLPLDQAAEAQTLKLESYMDDALARDTSLQVKRGDDLFGLPGDGEAEQALKRADTGYEESLAAFNDRDYDDAERKLRATLKEFQKAAGAMTECGHYCDAIAMYGSVMNQRGEVDEAKLSLLDLMALSPAYLLPAKVYGRDYIALRAKVGTSFNAALRASAMVKTHPSGARVYVDNTFVGFSPLALPQQQAGKHLLRIERPGFQKFGRIIELSPEDQVISVDLVGTPAYKSFTGLTGKLQSEVQSESGGQTLANLGRTLGLDRGVIGTVRQLRDSNATELVVGLFDLRSGKKLASKKVVFQGDEFGQLKTEASHVVYGLLNSAGGPTASGTSRGKPQGGDPLDGRNGMESWTDDAARHDPPKKKAGDPLDGVDGMEDW
jgi:hypothetical protein